ncbi:conjugal transfer protein TrbI [Synechococcus sp. TAK9802]|uniref:conjugal transfer protein TrbI n=1 Tax=Synechococcus sp. TAK9802 TaxID=1442558 RepID=UPI0016440071|nr:conjugal transfer protein TrbI [Synechococcus sp. TAK9802]QNI61365.1 metallothionein/ family 14 [Synechococcus sp. TAK9802]
MALATPCGCPCCTCEVQASQAFVHDGLSFCSEACATGQPKHEPCHASGSCGFTLWSEAVG